jgi:predicted acetyltransferase
MSLTLRPVELLEVDRSHRAVLENLGQLYRHDLSEPYELLPNDDGTFNNRPLDRFLTADDPDRRAFLIKVAGRLGGFVLTMAAEGGGTAIDGFFVVRALRRGGVGREAALRTIALFPGRWWIGFQRYNPGLEAFWTGVAATVAGSAWEMHDLLPAPENRPPDTVVIFETPAAS